MLMKFLRHPKVVFAYKCYDIFMLTAAAGLGSYAATSYFLAQMAMGS